MPATNKHKVSQKIRTRPHLHTKDSIICREHASARMFVQQRLSDLGRMVPLLGTLESPCTVLVAKDYCFKTIYIILTLPLNVSLYFLPAHCS